MKKSQVWFLDFIVGLMMFMIIIFVYYDYSNNLVEESESVWEEMMIDSKVISSSLMSTGYPPDWNQTNVARIGLLNSNYRINQTKVNNFVNMSYNETRGIFATRFDFYFFLQDTNNTEYFHAGLEPQEPKFLVQTTRLAIYNSSVYRMVIYIWG
jgi:hypothetical protein